ncbi:hemerythrin family protein [Geomonas sp.]|uniref:bacteriohemerythrin n=1 Tax=Geomonas sp. TaxID=2651584 RepID=UPI002B48CC8C|nr:hemerythrin family protein [Geomonas sp.]HJV35148.1 hemerythrin family protein [Geomonas sp.]
MVQWQDSLSIGVLEIDIQHKLLFDKFNAFLAACDAEAENDAIFRLFWFVEAYAVTHFGQEEKLMQEVRYPGIEMHRQRHQEFTSEVARLKEVLKNEGPSPTVISTMTDFVSGWLVDHISTMDRAIANYVASCAGA